MRIIRRHHVPYLLFWHQHLLHNFWPSPYPSNKTGNISSLCRLLNFLQMFHSEFFWRASVLFTEYFKESDLIRESGFEYNFINRLFRFQQQIFRYMQTTLLNHNRRTFFPHLLHFPVKAANADSQMIGYETGSQFLLLNMVIDNLQNRLLELFRFLMCQFTICLFKRADC